MSTIDNMRHEYSSCKVYWILILGAQLALFALSAAAMFVTSSRAVVVVGIAVFVIPPLSFLLKRRADDHYERGEALRRSHLLERSLGRKPAVVDQLFAAADGSSGPVLDPDVDGNYFASNDNPGLHTLVENVEESAFYTRTIARYTSNVAGAVAIAGSFVAVTILWSAAQAPRSSPSTLEAAAKLFPQLFAFFAVGLFADLWSSYRGLSKTAEQVVRTCEAFGTEPDPPEVFRIVGEYDCALAKTPPLPGTIKWLLNDRLSRAWRQIKKRTAT